MDPDIDGEYGILRDRVLISRGGLIDGIYSANDPEVKACAERIDLDGALVSPGFVDCHTHLVFAGNRAREWEMRLNGASYGEIAAAGGGIRSTVNATRAADFKGLYALSEERLKAMAACGVTTVEIKSGYGLDLDNERKQLAVAAALKKNCPMDISPTLLAAHSVPPEYSGRPEDYMEEICAHILPRLWREGLFEAADVFCENIAFNRELTEKLFKTASSFGIPVKGHNEQMSNMGGSALTARYGGWSTDHVEQLDEEGVKALSSARTAAVLLPSAFYFLRDTHVPPVGLLRQYRIPMAVATDYNPGTSPFSSIRQAMNMACTLFGLTPAEAMTGVTGNAAKALGREHICGRLKKGFRADFLIWKAESPAELIYELGPNPLLKRVVRGKASLFGFGDS
jgi:imidazolonepropionase